MKNETVLILVLGGLGLFMVFMMMNQKQQQPIIVQSGGSSGGLGGLASIGSALASAFGF